jgi:glutathionylspermidine synthase
VKDVLTTEADLSADVFEQIRIRTIFDCCKWDPQFEDVGALAPFPLILSTTTWEKLRKDAETLASEALAAEEEILHRSGLWKELGIPRPIRAALRSSTNHSPGFARVMRFDFHLTPDGWRISEVNSDVPGGFVEGSGFASLMSAAYTNTTPAGDAAAAYADTIATHFGVSSDSGTKPRAGLIHATGYTDDRQVMVFLGRALESRGVATELLGPGDVSWNGDARSASTGAKFDGLIRFFPAEWLPNLPKRAHWTAFFSGSPALLSNPGASLFTQSKRFPLVWDRLSTRLPAWRALLPETRDPRNAKWRANDDWVLKPVLGRVGEGIGIHGVTRAKEWKQISRSAQWWPSYWVAQKRFEAVSVRHNDEAWYPCIGVFVIDGRAAGTYGRIAARPLIDSKARDVAILVRN